MSQIELFSSEDIAKIHLPKEIKYLNIGVDELIEMLAKFPLEDAPKIIYADPPWSYSQAPGVANPELQYEIMTDKRIAEHLRATHPIAAKNSRLVTWSTWPKLAEFWKEFGSGTPWKYVTGGSWHKEGGNGGVGYHWLGRSEPILVYKKGSPTLRWDSFSNAHNSRPDRHSVKPVGFLEGMLERWTDEEDLIVDLYAGLGSMALACHNTGRRYLGAEIDKCRHLQGLNWLFARGCGWQ